MPKAIVIYDSKYGNTRQVAEGIAEGLMEVPGTEATVGHHGEVDAVQLEEFDAILVGSPNHLGTATGGIRRFIDGLGKLSPDGKLVAVFDTYINKDAGKAVSRMEKRLADKAPRLEVASPGLSIRVDGMKGPIASGELARCREFGAMLGNRLKERAAARD